MKYHISADDLIRYIYQEVSFLEKMAIEKAMRHNSQLREDYQQLIAAQKSLNQIVDDNPNESALTRILAYSQLSNFETEFFSLTT